MTRTLFRRLLPAVLAGLLAAAPALAQGTAPTPPAPSPPAPAPSMLDTIIKGGTLRVGLTQDYRPFSIADAAGKVEGIDVDMANSLAKALGVKLEIVKTSWPSLKSDLESGKFDIAMGGITITLDRQKVGLFSTPVLSSGKTPITRCGSEKKFATLKEIDRPGVRVIVNPGGTNERFAKQFFPHSQLIEYPDNVTIFKQILDGHADVMVTDASETLLQQKLNPGLCSVHPDKPFQFGEKAYLLPRGDIAWQQYVDQWLHLARSTGEFQAVVDKWLK
jgi:cyclohexadienyl dehydratase